MLIPNSGFPEEPEKEDLDKQMVLTDGLGTVITKITSWNRAAALIINHC